jgi:hypothetical protein
VLRLVIGEPTQLGRRNRRDRHDTDAVGPLPRTAQLGDELTGRITRASIVPQQRISDYSARIIETYHAMLLGAH